MIPDLHRKSDLPIKSFLIASYQQAASPSAVILEIFQPHTSISIIASHRNCIRGHLIDPPHQDVATVATLPCEPAPNFKGGSNATSPSRHPTSRPLPYQRATHFRSRTRIRAGRNGRTGTECRRIRAFRNIAPPPSSLLLRREASPIR